MVERKLVGGPLYYRGSRITATLLGPDLLGQIDGEEMPHFYMGITALQTCAMKAIDERIKEQEQRTNEKHRTSR